MLKKSLKALICEKRETKKQSTKLPSEMMTWIQTNLVCKKLKLSEKRNLFLFVKTKVRSAKK